MLRLNFAGLALFAGLLALLGACDSDSGPPTEPTYSISGSVTPAMAGIPVTLAGPVQRTATTDASGDFVFSGLEPGVYTVGPAEPGFIFEPAERAVTLSGTDVATQPFLRSVPDEGVSMAELARLETIPDSRLPVDSVILPNGQQLDDYLLARGFLDGNGNLLPLDGDWPLRSLNAAAPAGPQQRKNDIVSRMLHAARDYACGRATPRCTKWDYPADPADPVNRPAQTGLTYVWGGKTLSQRIRGVDRCPAYTYGLDCSGLIGLVAAAGGLTAPGGSGNQADPAAWNIPASWQLKWKLVTDGTIQAGDLLGWPGHIGIAESNGAGTKVNFISSTGAPNACAANMSKGPRMLPVSAWSGPPTRVLRLVTTLSGEFDMYLRCTEEDTDAAVIRFTINNDEGGPFRATGSGIDYDGSPLSFILEGSYNQITNTLTARLSLADGSRVDGLEVRLLDDDTGYFPLSKIVDNTGCHASARLVRVQPGAMLTRVRAPHPSGRRTGPRLGGPGVPRGS
ncbi:MAG TPA: hypothetical protein VHG93_01435 [Longimicrobium sp.]|nr:hypothetical protein [Longimicrobium sp.]